MSNEIQCSLRRIFESDAGTFGIFEAPEIDITAVSLELPWRGNLPMISRIPPAKYRAGWGWSSRLRRDVYRLEDVKGRAGILIHPANFAGNEAQGWESELSGCIALGGYRAIMQNHCGIDQDCISDSRHMVEKFERAADRRPLEILITDSFGEVWPDCFA